MSWNCGSNLRIFSVGVRTMRYYWWIKICSILARRYIDSPKSWQIAWGCIWFKVWWLLSYLFLHILTTRPHLLCLFLQLIAQVLLPDPLNRFEPFNLILLLCLPLRPLPLFFQLQHPFLPLHAFLLLRVTYHPLIFTMLRLRRLPDREVPLDQSLLQVVPLRYSRIMVLEDFDTVLEFEQLLLGETFDLPRFQHLETFVCLVKGNALSRLVVLV